MNETTYASGHRHSRKGDSTLGPGRSSDGDNCEKQMGDSVPAELAALLKEGSVAEQSDLKRNYVKRLPDDILIDICQVCTSYEWTAPLTFVLVCQSWQRIVVSAPILWRNVILSDDCGLEEDLVRVFVALSDPVPLHIRIRFSTPETDIRRIISLLSEWASRIDSLEVLEDNVTLPRESVYTFQSGLRDVSLLQAKEVRLPHSWFMHPNSWYETAIHWKEFVNYFPNVCRIAADRWLNPGLHVPLAEMDEFLRAFNHFKDIAVALYLPRETSGYHPDGNIVSSTSNNDDIPTLCVESLSFYGYKALIGLPWLYPVVEPPPWLQVNAPNLQSISFYNIPLNWIGKCLHAPGISSVLQDLSLSFVPDGHDQKAYTRDFRRVIPDLPYLSTLRLFFLFFHSLDDLPSLVARVEGACDRAPTIRTLEIGVHTYDLGFPLEPSSTSEIQAAQVVRLPKLSEVIVNVQDQEPDEYDAILLRVFGILSPSLMGICVLTLNCPIVPLNLLLHVFTHAPRLDSLNLNKDVDLEGKPDWGTSPQVESNITSGSLSIGGFFLLLSWVNFSRLRILAASENALEKIPEHKSKPLPLVESFTFEISGVNYYQQFPLTPFRHLKILRIVHRRKMDLLQTEVFYTTMYSLFVPEEGKQLYCPSLEELVFPCLPNDIKPLLRLLRQRSQPSPEVSQLQRFGTPFPVLGKIRECIFLAFHGREIPESLWESWRKRYASVLFFHSVLTCFSQGRMSCLPSTWSDMPRTWEHDPVSVCSA